MLEKFPDRYPYVNKYGQSFSELEVDRLYLELLEVLKALKRKAEDFHMEVVETMLKVMDEYNPGIGVPLRLYSKLILKYKISNSSVRKTIKLPDPKDSSKVIEVPIREVQLEEEMVQVSEADLTDKKSVLYSIVRYVERRLGARYSLYLQAKYLGHTDKAIAEQMGIGLRTVSRIRQQVEDVLGEL